MKRCERRINHGRKSYGERDHNRGFQTWLPLYSGQRIINSGGNIFKRETAFIIRCSPQVYEGLKDNHQNSSNAVFQKNFSLNFWVFVHTCVFGRWPWDHNYHPSKVSFLWSFLGFRDFKRGIKEFPKLREFASRINSILWCCAFWNMEITKLMH